MQRKIKIGNLEIAGIILLVVLLVCVRLFQEQLFYDPLLPFFKTENRVLPEYDSFKLFLGLAFRYLLNTAISIGIIYLCFKDRAMLRLTVILYAVFFAVLIAAFFLVINAEDVNLLLLFYIRRFLIQPLFLILFLPAFYYQKKMH